MRSARTTSKPPHAPRGRASVASLGLALVALASAGCTRNQLLDFAMNRTPHVTRQAGARVGDRVILAGDMHCHVRPPDSRSHVSRELPATLKLAREEGLDFVVLTPHVPARFYLDDETRARVLSDHAALRAEVNRSRAEADGVIVIPGFEYTDRRWGHLGMGFADVSEVLGSVSADALRERPQAFFEAFVAHGGVVTFNHPVNRPLRDPPFSELTRDMSWRAFYRSDVPDDVAWVTRHAQAIETYNASATLLRDRFLLDDEERSLREASHVLDRVARRDGRRLAAVGGSDSHGHWLRATTFVLAKARTEPAIREAIASGRTCVRGPEACTLTVRAKGDPGWAYVGDDIPADARPKMDPNSGVIEARAIGGDVSLFVNGELVATGDGGDLLTASVPRGRCSTVRAVVGKSWSSPVYVGCNLDRALAPGAPASVADDATPPANVIEEQAPDAPANVIEEQTPAAPSPASADGT